MSKPLEPVPDGSKIPTKLLFVGQLMTPDQLIEWLQIQKATLYGWVHRRQIPFFKLGPKQLMHGGERERDARPLRFDYYEILDWMKTGEMPDRFKR